MLGLDLFIYFMWILGEELRSSKLLEMQILVFLPQTLCLSTPAGWNLQF